MLCQRCASLDAKDLFFDDGRENDSSRESSTDSPVSTIKFIQELGKFEPPQWQPSCSGCQLFDSVKMTGAPFSDGVSYKLYSGPLPMRFRDHVQKPGRVLYVVDDELARQLLVERGFLAGKVEVMPDHFIMLAGGSTSEERTFRSDNGHINFELLKGWFQTCERDHKTFCRKAGSMISESLQDFSVINCQTREIVPMHNGCRYAALSYVWGDRQLDVDTEFLDDKHLSQVLPQTIEDAILVTTKLGIAYIWIDRYCIEQNDDVRKMEQINKMDFIYKEAAVVLVAAVGRDPAYGLPGVSKVLRPARSRAYLGSEEVVASRPDVISDIYSSRWICRGWTFQEAYFATCMLAFTEHEIYYECREMTARESLFEPVRIWPRLLFERRDDQTTMWVDIGKFGARILSYESDALRAFGGVFHDYSLHKPYTMEHHVGIPILPMTHNWIGAVHLSAYVDRSQSFISGLCWVNVMYTRRRKGFPSWSWAGWDGAVEHNAFPADSASYTDDDEPPRIFIEDADGRAVDFESFIARPGEVSRLENFRRFIHIEAWTINLDAVYLPDLNRDIIHAFYPRFVDRDLDVHSYPSRWGVVFDAEDVEIYYSIDLLVDKDARFSDKQTKFAGCPWTVIGVILENPNKPENFSKWSHSVSKKGPLVVLLEEHDGFYERVGHMWIGKHSRRAFQKPDVEPVSDDAPEFWELCSKTRQRRRLRIG